MLFLLLYFLVLCLDLSYKKKHSIMTNKNKNEIGIIVLDRYP